MAMRVLSIVAAFVFCTINIAMDGMMLYAIQIPGNKGLAFTFVAFLLSLVSMVTAAIGVALVVILKRFRAERMMFYALYAYILFNIPNVAALILLPAAIFVIFVLKLTVIPMHGSPRTQLAASR